MARGYSNDPRRIVRLKKVKQGQGPLIPPRPPAPPTPPRPARPTRKGGGGAKPEQAP